MEVPQQRFTCSKLTIENLRKVVKYVQSQQYRHQDGIIDFIVVTLVLW